MSIETNLDGAVVSAREKMVKPDPAIFAKLIERGGLQPEGTLFIDDSPANIAAALVFGMHGFCFNAPGKLSAFIGETGED